MLCSSQTCLMLLLHAWHEIAGKQQVGETEFSQSSLSLAKTRVGIKAPRCSSFAAVTQSGSLKSVQVGQQEPEVLPLWGQEPSAAKPCGQLELLRLQRSLLLVGLWNSARSSLCVNSGKLLVGLCVESGLLFKKQYMNNYCVYGWREQCS